MSSTENSGVESGYRWLDPEHTRRAGRLLATCLEHGDAIGLVGDLGAGKTLFVQALARGLGVPPDVRVTSPTFTLINEYHGGRIPLYHADLYRIGDARELDEIGIHELCRSGHGVVCVEWSDRFPVLGPDHLQIRIHVVDDTTRQVTVQPSGPRSHALARAWTQLL